MNCGIDQSWDYDAFEAQLTQKAAQQRIPIKGSLELTFRCNLRCQHCYVAHAHRGLPGQLELSTPEIHNLLDQVTDAGCLWFLLTGGEPLLRKDFDEIYLYARRKGLLLYLFTNGTLLDPRRADLLAEWRPFCVEITLYGYTQQTYERITGVPGSHARCMRAIELLLERKVPLRLKTVLMTLNQPELGQMQAFSKSLGVNFYYNGQVHMGLDRQSGPAALRIPPGQLVQMEWEDPAQRSAWGEIYGASTQSASPGVYRCNAGLDSFHIDPYGQLSLCMLDRSQQFDLRRGSFRDGWRDFLAAARAPEYSEHHQCTSCSLRSVCSHCPGWAWLEQGDPESRVEYICDLTHQRAEMFS